MVSLGSSTRRFDRVRASWADIKTDWFMVSHGWIRILTKTSSRSAQSGKENIFLNTGGRYNPSTDSWRSTSPTNAPAARYGHTAVWTGSEMIVWGGVDYNQATLNSGVPARTVGQLPAPPMRRRPRQSHGSVD